MDWIAMSAPWLAAETEIEAAHKVILDELLLRADVQSGDTVLDMGCGSGGSLLRLADAVGPQGRVLGVDIAPPMVERAAERVVPPVEVAVGDGQSHAFEPGAFDVAMSLFGLMFFADTGAAFANIRTALKPGGRMCFAAWGAPANNAWFSVGGRIAGARLGALPPPEPHATGPFAFADAARVLALLNEAGWDADVDTVSLHMKPRGSAADVADLQMTIGGPSMLMRERAGTAEDGAVIRAGLTQAFTDMEENGQVLVPAEIHYFSAVSRG